MPLFSDEQYITHALTRLIFFLFYLSHHRCLFAKRNFGLRGKSLEKIRRRFFLIFDLI